MENPQEFLARLRGQDGQPRLDGGYHAPDVSYQPAYHEPAEQAVTRSELDELRIVVSRLEVNVNRMAAVMQDQQAMIERMVQSGLQGAVSAAVAEHLKRPLDPCKEFPEFETITKLKVEYFHNKGQRGIPLHQLKCCVWTCDKAETQRYPYGTCGFKLIPLFDPRSSVAKTKRFGGGKLDYLQAVEGGAKFAGCLKPKVFDQAAVVMPDDRLILSLRGHLVDLGRPKPQRDDAADRASRLIWFWPETAR